MNRVEFINKTCMDDVVRQTVLEVFWDQYMLVCELADNIEEVTPIPIAVDTGRIAFQLIYSDPECANRMKDLISNNGFFCIYERQFRITYQLDTSPTVVTITIE